MSSIMRWLNGLMACLVIGDAPVLSEVVETPRSQDRTPASATPETLPCYKLPRERFSRVLGMLSSLEVKVLYPT